MLVHYIVCVSAFLFTILPIVADEAKIPDGYELYEGTLSPDERYGVIYSTQDDSRKEFPPNLLVQFNPYRVLEKIHPGTRPNATTELLAEWNGNSLVALYQFRKWGLVNLWIYKLEENGEVKTQNVLEAARKIFREDFQERLLKKYPNEEETIVFVSPEGEEEPKRDFEFQGRQLVLDLFADNKPNLSPGPHWTAELKATWDIDRGEFTSIHLKPHPIKIRKNQ